MNLANTKVTLPPDTENSFENWAPPLFTEKPSRVLGNTYPNKKQKGKAGEDSATALLVQQGFKILKRNWRTPYGEVDLVASKGTILFIFEIKTLFGWLCLLFKFL